MRTELIREAREWIGTPFHHQAALKGVGCDCGGLVRGVGVNTGALTLTAEQWKRHANYGRVPNPRRMERTLRTLLVFQWRRGDGERPALMPGDVVWMEWRQELPMHLGIIATLEERTTLIHATSDIGRVVEHGLTADFSTRIHSIWCYPGVIGGS